jgi:hypothetical protein
LWCSFFAASAVSSRPSAQIFAHAISSCPTSLHTTRIARRRRRGRGHGHDGGAGGAAARRGGGGAQREAAAAAAAALPLAPPQAMLPAGADEPAPAVVPLRAAMPQDEVIVRLRRRNQTREV